MREKIRLLEENRDNELLSVCLKALDIPESSYFYVITHPETELQNKERYRGLRKKVERIIKKHPRYGYRRLKDALAKEKININPKPLKKLLKLWHLQRLRRVKRPKPSPLAQHLKELGTKANLVARLKKVHLFQIIFTDFSEIICQKGAFYLILFSEKISRRILGWAVASGPDAKTALKAYLMTRCYLKKLKVDLRTVIIHQDQGSAFISYEYAGTLLNDGISLSFTEKGFRDNPAIESCIGHFKDEYSDQIQEAQNLKELKKIIRRCVKDWNKERIHSALKGRSPDEFIHTFYKLKKS